MSQDELNIEQAKANLQEVVENIESSRCAFDEHHIVQTIAISKYNTADEIKALYQAGQRAFGESKVQDLQKKQKLLDNLPIAWHFIGRLQSNKINALLKCKVVLFHSLNSYELALKLDKKLKEQKTLNTLNALMQVNISNSDTQGGIYPKELMNVVDNIYKNCTSIKLKGLMCIGKNTKNKDEINKCFAQMYELHKQVKGKYPQMTILSSGMSYDYTYAIKNGSNMIRIGSVLFKK